MSNETAKEVIDELMPIFEATEQVLNDWTEESNLQFPVLLEKVVLKLNMTEKQARENDPIIRKYVRMNKDWYVTRGAKGGIMRASDKQKKEALKVAKDLAKKELEEALKAKEAASKAAATVVVTEPDASGV